MYAQRVDTCHVVVRNPANARKATSWAMPDLAAAYGQFAEAGSAFRDAFAALMGSLDGKSIERAAPSAP
jgi:hypothetical protein